MARTPLMGRLLRLAKLSRIARRTGIPGPELAEMQQSRRRFLQVGGAALAATGLSACASTPRNGGSGGKAKVVIAGAGIAGLNCAYKLGDAVDVAIYEAADRTGGRIFTKDGSLNKGQTLEIGGSFIDSGHEDMLELCREFKLELLDMTEDKGLIDTAYYFGGKHYSDREVLDALAPFVERMEKDAAWLEKDWAALQSDRVVRDLDNTSIAKYLADIGVSGWLKALLEVAFVTEYGREADDQSCFNMLCLIGLDTSKDRWEAFGESDERYKIKGGNQRVVDELAKRLEDKISTAHKLVRVREAGSGFELAFDHHGKTVELKADVVVLTLPFSALRDVELDVKMPDEKRRAIDQLGYGTNAKLMVGTKSRPWRDKGYAGGIFSDEGFQLAWDNARLQPGEGGGITLYSGGKPGVTVGEGTPREQVERLLPGLDKAFPGVEAAWNHNLFRMHWPSHAFTKASYACYRPGQWTTVSGHEIEPVGNLLFAGEHCSSDHQGYMNGGAETGRMAAEAVMAAMQK